jgi:DNA-3-methyladenine glycosylase
MLDKSFYNRDALIVAKELLRKVLVRNINGQTYKGILTETEAYRGNNDRASPMPFWFAPSSLW